MAASELELPSMFSFLDDNLANGMFRAKIDGRTEV